MFNKIKGFIFGKRPRRFRDRANVFYDLTDEHGLSYVNMSDAINYIPVYKGEPLFENDYVFKFEGAKKLEEVGSNIVAATRTLERFTKAMRAARIRERGEINRYFDHDISALTEVSNNE